MVYVPERYVKPHQHLRPGDIVLVGSSGSATAVGRSAQLRETWDGSFGAFCSVIRPLPGLDPRFLALFVASPYVRRLWRDLAQGTNINNLKPRDLAGTIVLVPPVAEQARIVAAIEEQMSRADAGEDALDRARRNLSNARTAAVQEVVSNALQSAGGVPTRVAELLSQPLANGRSVPDGPLDGFPVLRLTAVKEGRIDTAFVKAGAWTAEDAKPYLIAKGDFLVVRGNGTKRLVGRGGLVTANGNISYPDTMIRMRFNQELLLPEFSALVWDSMYVRKQIETKARTTAGIYKINQRDLQEVYLPVPSIEDQRRLLAQVESGLTNIAAIQKAVAMATLRVKALRSSLLVTRSPAGSFHRTQWTNMPRISLIAAPISELHPMSAG